MRHLPFISRFRREEDGTVAILWGTALVAFLGFLAITLDVGRLSATQAELQAFADNVALAAAGELDGKTDSITRATNAAANMINDSQTFANGSNVLSGATDYTLVFHSDMAIPPGILDGPMNYSKWVLKCNFPSGNCRSARGPGAAMLKAN